MSKTPVYGYCAAGCKRQVVSKEELTLVTKEKYAELEANGELVEGCVYVITNDNTIEETMNNLEQFNKVMKGDGAVPKATEATNADNLNHLYLHTISVIINKYEKSSVYFSLSYTDTSLATKDENFVWNNIVWAEANIFVPVFVFGSDESGPFTYTYIRAAFSKDASADTGYRISVYDKDNSATNIYVQTVTVTTGKVIKIR